MRYIVNDPENVVPIYTMVAAIVSLSPGTHVAPDVVQTAEGAEITFRGLEHPPVRYIVPNGPKSSMLSRDELEHAAKSSGLTVDQILTAMAALDSEKRRVR